MTTPPFQTACEIRDAIAAGRVSALEVCEAALTRIASLDARLGGFRTVDADRARRRAALVDREQ